MTESELIKKVKKRNREAQQALYTIYKRIWFSICLRYHSNHSDAEDVLQNALIKIFTKVELFDAGKGSFKSWSAKIVVNENLMAIRKNINSFKVDPLNDDLHALDENETPLDSLSAQELTNLIAKLPEGYRTVFNLYVIDGYNHQEIGEMLNISVGTSKSQLFKARRMLQLKLEQLI